MAGMEISGKRAAISLGLLLAILHTAGVLLIVATGGWLIGWAESLHFMTTGAAYTAVPFDVLTLIIGIVSAFIVGAVIGWLFAWIWNMNKD